MFKVTLKRPYSRCRRLVTSSYSTTSTKKTTSNTPKMTTTHPDQNWVPYTSPKALRNDPDLLLGSSSSLLSRSWRLLGCSWPPLGRSCTALARGAQRGRTQAARATRATWARAGAALGRGRDRHRSGRARRVRCSSASAGRRRAASHARQPPTPLAWVRSAMTLSVASHFDCLIGRDTRVRYESCVCAVAA